jgi:Glycosyl hydrolase family 76
MMLRIVYLGSLLILVICAASPYAAADESGVVPLDYLAAAQTVTKYIDNHFALPSGLYRGKIGSNDIDFMWGNGVMFPALVGAARHDPADYLPGMNRFFVALNAYWDARTPPAGYEPWPPGGGNDDRYYDDNAWMVLSFTEAYQLTGDHRYFNRAKECLDFVLSGWDDVLGGGIWWHARHKGGSKNVCANAPAAVGCLRIASYLPRQQARGFVARAEQIVAWTDQHFRDRDGLYFDSIVVSSGKINHAKLTYNTALMIRALLGLYRATGNQAYLSEARQSAFSADWFLDQHTGAYRDPVKWAHLLVEADLEMFRATGDKHFLLRATNNADFEFDSWTNKPPVEAIDNASIARTLWLMADMQTPEGRRFWYAMDARLGNLAK